MAGAHFDVTHLFLVSFCPAFGSRADTRGSRGEKVSTVTLVAGSCRSEADVCPWALAFCLASKNTDPVNFFESRWHRCIYSGKCAFKKKGSALSSPLLPAESCCAGGRKRNRLQRNNLVVFASPTHLYSCVVATNEVKCFCKVITVLKAINPQIR